MRNEPKSTWDDDEDTIGSKLWWEKKDRKHRAAQKVKYHPPRKPTSIAGVVRAIEKAARRREGIARGTFGKF